MKRLLMRATLAFGAGSLGALANSLALWLLGAYGITASLGVHLAPDLTPPWLYARLVWGGIWGFLFLLPLWRNKPYRRGLLLSLAPTLVQLLIVFPYHTRQGTMGMGLGALTPVFVIALNALWGMVASLWLRLVGE
ncbi:MAG: hypothetical protein GY849_18280 [Deltaproteobacteria bacterium]|nr:hypothetical protein [Deltaproteobacteria bacterium]